MRLLPSKVIYFFLVVLLPLLLFSINSDGFSRATPDLSSDFIDKASGQPEFFPEPKTTVTISGLITKSQSIPLEGVTITFSGLGSTTTNSSGFYTMAVPYNWSGSAIPTYCDYSFSPTLRVYSSIKIDKIAENYTGSVSVSYTLSGVVTYAENGQPFANKGIAFGNGISVITNSTGQYELELASCWNGTLTPSSNGVTFNPPSRTYSQIQQNYFNQNFQVSNPSIIRPPNWDYPNTGVVHIISLQYTAAPDVCGEMLQPGDWIGTFFKNSSGQLVCAGAAQWTGASSNIALLPQGDDPYTAAKDGFAYGEVFNWRVFRWSDSTEYVTYVTFQTGTGMSTDNKFYSNGLSLVSAIDGYTRLNMTIPEGWSGFSSWFNPPNALKPVNQLFQPVLSNLTILQTLTKMYFPGQNINTIGNWNPRAGYEIKLTDTVTLPFYGCLETNRTVSMAAGWNLLPVLTPCEISISEFLASVISKVIIVQEVAKPNIYWPSLGINTIGNLKPGRAYLIKVNATTSVTYSSNWLNCDPVEMKSESLPTPVYNNPWNEVSPNPSAHYIVFPGEILSGCSYGTVIGAFTTEGICAGVTEISDPNENHVLIAYADDNFTSGKNGLDFQELISFKAYDPEKQIVSDLLVNYDFSQPNFDGRFFPGGISMIKTMESGFSDIQETAQSSLILYPNPADQYCLVSGMNPSELLKISLFTSDGQLIQSQNVYADNKIDVKSLKPGVYFVRVSNKYFSMAQKLLIQR